MGMRDSPCMLGGRAPTYTYFSFCSLASFVHFKPKVGFTSSPATEDTLGLGRRAVGDVSVAVLSCGPVWAEPPTSGASPTHPTLLKQPPGCACVGLTHPKFEQSPCAAMREPCRGRLRERLGVICAVRGRWQLSAERKTAKLLN